MMNVHAVIIYPDYVLCSLFIGHIWRGGSVARSFLMGISYRLKTWSEYSVLSPRFFCMYVSVFFTILPMAGDELAFLNLKTIMEKKMNNEELQSRREFFKKAAKAALPVIGAVVLSSMPIVQTKAVTGCDGCYHTCNGGCSGGCENSCSSRCSYSCQGNSDNDSKRNCFDCSNECFSGCKGSCYGSCSGSCKSGSYKKY